MRLRLFLSRFVSLYLALCIANAQLVQRNLNVPEKGGVVVSFEADEPFNLTSPVHGFVGDTSFSLPRHFELSKDMLTSEHRIDMDYRFLACQNRRADVGICPVDRVASNVDVSIITPAGNGGVRMATESYNAVLPRNEWVSGSVFCNNVRYYVLTVPASQVQNLVLEVVQTSTCPGNLDGQVCPFGVVFVNGPDRGCPTPLSHQFRQTFQKHAILSLSSLGGSGRRALRLGQTYVVGVAADAMTGRFDSTIGRRNSQQVVPLDRSSLACCNASLDFNVRLSFPGEEGDFYLSFLLMLGLLILFIAFSLTIIVCARGLTDHFDTAHIINSALSTFDEFVENERRPEKHIKPTVLDPSSPVSVHVATDTSPQAAAPTADSANPSSNPDPPALQRSGSSRSMLQVSKERALFYYAPIEMHLIIRNWRNPLDVRRDYRNQKRMTILTRDLAHAMRAALDYNGDSNGPDQLYEELEVLWSEKQHRLAILIKPRWQGALKVWFKVRTRRDAHGNAISPRLQVGALIRRILQENEGRVPHVFRDLDEKEEDLKDLTHWQIENEMHNVEMIVDGDVNDLIRSHGEKGREWYTDYLEHQLQRADSRASCLCVRSCNPMAKVRRHKAEKEQHSDAQQSVQLAVVTDRSDSIRQRVVADKDQMTVARRSSQSKSRPVAWEGPEESPEDHGDEDEPRAHVALPIGERTSSHAKLDETNSAKRVDTSIRDRRPRFESDLEDDHKEHQHEQQQEQGQGQRAMTTQHWEHRRSSLYGPVKLERTPSEIRDRERVLLGEKLSYLHWQLRANDYFFIHTRAMNSTTQSTASARWYFRCVMIAAVFAAVPALQNALIEAAYGQDVQLPCHFNNLCRRDWQIFDWLRIENANGVVISNIAYVLSGGFIYFVWARHFPDAYRNHLFSSTKYKEHTILLQALGASIGCEGFFSSIYHVCPTFKNFQYDSIFIFLTCGLALVGLWNRRHSSQQFSPFAFFIFFCCVVALNFFGVYSTMLGTTVVFWIVFFILALPLTFLASWRQHSYLLRVTPEDNDERDDQLKEIATQQFSIWGGHMYMYSAEVWLDIKFMLQDLGPNTLNFLVRFAVTLSVNWGIIFYSFAVDNSSSTVFLILSGVNLGVYSIWYTMMKVATGETVKAYVWVAIAVFFGVSASALLLFFDEVTRKEWPLDFSRQLNAECRWLALDSHDLWHVLSSVALLLLAILLHHLDDGIDPTGFRPIKLF